MVVPQVALRRTPSRRSSAGQLHNALAVVGLLAAAEARRGGWQGLRPPDAPWPAPHWPLG